MGSCCTKITRLGSPGALSIQNGASLKPGSLRISPVCSLCMWPLKLALFSLPVPYLPHGLELTLVTFGWCCVVCVTSGLRLPLESLLGQLLPFQEPCMEFRVCLVGWAPLLKTRHCWVCQQLLLLSLISVWAMLLCVTTAKGFPIGNWKYCCAYQTCFKAGV